MLIPSIHHSKDQARIRPLPQTPPTSPMLTDSVHHPIPRPSLSHSLTPNLACRYPLVYEALLSPFHLFAPITRPFNYPVKQLDPRRPSLTRSLTHPALQALYGPPISHSRPSLSTLRAYPYRFPTLPRLRYSTTPHSSTLLSQPHASLAASRPSLAIPTRLHSNTQPLHLPQNDYVTP